MRKIWPFSFNVVFFGSIAFVAPFFVLYYQKLEFTGAQIGILTGVPPIVSIFAAPFWPGLADKTRRHRLILSLTLLLGGAGIFIFPYLKTFMLIFIAGFLFNLFFAPISSFADTATMFMLGDKKEMYGRIRVGGTIGFGIAVSIAGVVVENYGLKFAFWGSSALIFLAFVLSQKFVYQPVPDHEGASTGGISTLLTNPRWVLFLILAFSGGVGFAATNNFFFPYMKELGARESTMGIAMTIGTVFEIPVLFFGNLLIKRFKAYGVLVLSMAMTGIRMLLFAITSDPGLVLFIQILNGITLPAMWMAGVAYADEKSPPGLAATAQGLFGAMVYGFGSAVGGFLGGPLLENLGGRGLYLFFGVVVLVILAVVLVIQTRLPSESVIGTETNA